MNTTGKKVTVQLVGEDGNAFAILGRVTAAMRKARWTQEEIDEYKKQAMSGDYDNLLAVTTEYVDEPEDDYDNDEIEDEEEDVI